MKSNAPDIFHKYGTEDSWLWICLTYCLRRAMTAIQGLAIFAQFIKIVQYKTELNF